uniref:Conserved plasma membrane protein n=1 Tax=Syphacia muris TaxID=451379 RepID=A0A0N5ASN8_9BILA
LQKNLLYVVTVTLISCAVWWICGVPGFHQPYIDLIRKNGLVSCSWIGLGILSSVGLGFGLHTFLLYLGPFIAQVTVAAYVCQSLDFPEPPYPNQVICPDFHGNGTDIVKQASVTIWGIMSKARNFLLKVRWEALCWGAGTALGELPPYFMAKAARISGEEPDDEEYREYMAYVKAIEKGTKPSLMKRMKLRVEAFMTGLIDKVGFFGILICASIPNPLFDLAGITCGYLLIPFWTFFGATLIGKAIIKMHLQMFAVVLAFSDQHLKVFLHYMGDIPFLGAPLQMSLRNFFENQKMKLRSRQISQSSDTLQQVFSILIGVMFAYFVLSIINSLAQRWHKRLCTAERKKLL